jgi:very-short-patch-repair endonuclease
MAAVLACGRGTAVVHGGGGDPAAADEKWTSLLDRWGAAISHRSAAVLWGLLPSVGEAVDVSIPGYGGRSNRPGIRVHRSASLRSEEVTLNRGIPVTKPTRTIADLRRTVSARRRRGVVSAKELRRATRQAEVLGLSLDPGLDSDRTRSELERDFLRLCRRHRLPEPEVNVGIGGLLVDFVWHGRRLVVETDGYRYHRGRRAFENDRDRDLRLRALGYDVVRFTDRQVTAEPKRVVTILRSALMPDAAGSPAGDRMRTL